MISRLLDRRYKILKILASGGFGQTYLAEDTRRPGHPPCVVKQLRVLSNKPGAYQTGHRLFKKEAEVLEKLGKHDQIPRLLAHFEENKEFYLVQEYIPGHLLSEEIVPGKPLPEARIISLLVAVLQILFVVHKHGVIHRDIKPNNIIRRQIDGKLVLIDFGSVKEINTQVASGAITQTVAIGTRAYMPIEQFKGYPQFNSDIYALGMMMIQALGGFTVEELLNLRVGNNPQTGEFVWRDRVQVSSRLADVIDKMVRFDFNQRYKSAREVLADLKSIVTNSKNLANTPRLITRNIGSAIASTVPAALASAGKFPAISANQKTQLEQTTNIARRYRWEAAATLLAAGGVIVALLTQLPHVFVFIGANKARGGNYQEAIQNFSWAIQLKSDRADAYYDRGFAFFEIGDNKRSLEDYTQALKLNSKLTFAYIGRGNARFTLQDYQGAIADYTKAIKITANEDNNNIPRGIAHRFLKDYQGEIKTKKQAIGSRPKDEALSYKQGFVSKTLENPPGAIQSDTPPLRIAFNLAVAYNNRGIARAKMGDNLGAIADISQAIRLSPNVADAWENRANIRRRLKDYNGAIADYTTALKINPNDGHSYYNRALVQVSLGNKQAALSDLQKAANICINQGFSSCYNNAQASIKQLDL